MLDSWIKEYFLFEARIEVDERKIWLIYHSELLLLLCREVELRSIITSRARKMQTKNVNSTYSTTYLAARRTTTQVDLSQGGSTSTWRLSCSWQQYYENGPRKIISLSSSSSSGWCQHGGQCRQAARTHEESTMQNAVSALQIPRRRMALPHQQLRTKKTVSCFEESMV